MNSIRRGYLEDRYFAGPTAERSSVPLERTTAQSVQTSAAASIDHLRRHIELLFQPVKRNRKETL